MKYQKLKILACYDITYHDSLKSWDMCIFYIKGSHHINILSWHYHHAELDIDAVRIIRFKFKPK